MAEAPITLVVVSTKRIPKELGPWIVRWAARCKGAVVLRPVGAALFVTLRNVRDTDLQALVRLLRDVYRIGVLLDEPPSPASRTPRTPNPRH